MLVKLQSDKATTDAAAVLDGKIEAAEAALSNGVELLTRIGVEELTTL